MSLSVGIVGLPNAGKSTLFNALAGRRLAETAVRPFTTIEAHEAVVPLPDARLDKLAKLVNPEKTTPATVTFIDIAGLVKGAHQGEGLGNQFLGKIRETDAIVHIARAFEDPNIPHYYGRIDPKEDIEVVNIELELGGITDKPEIYVVNVGEGQLTASSKQLTAESWGLPADIPIIVISAKLEEELVDLETEERKQYLKELGVRESGLERLIKEAYKLLELITFYTIKGGREVRAWSIKNGAIALDAAATVHTDFAQNFIKAEVINVKELLEAGSWQKAKEHGKVKLEGRDYLVRHQDVIEFKVGV